MPNPTEVAEIRVDGQRYRDWLSVEVVWATGDPFCRFRFTCSEGVPLLKNWSEFRIRPGQFVDIFLAGQPAIINAMVLTRQVAYTATHHGIEIAGVSRNGAAVFAGANTKTGEFRNATPLQVIKKLYGMIGVGVKQIGKIDNSSMHRFSIPPGQTIWGAIEPITRMAGATIGSAIDGTVLLGVGGGLSGDPLIEGVNILEGRELLSIKDGAGPDVTVAQRGATDNESGPKVTHEPFSKATNQIMQLFGGGGTYSARTTLMELPGLIANTATRAGFEGAKRPDEMANVTITVQGWVMSNGSLWPHPMNGGTQLHVDSVMLLLHEPLKLVKVTFTQDVRAGTRTTLELVRVVEGGIPADIRTEAEKAAQAGGGPIQ